MITNSENSKIMLIQLYLKTILNFQLYADRLITSAEDTDSALIPSETHNSEKRIIERFFLTNKEVRQAYIVVDWLERNARDANERMITQQMEWFTDATVRFYFFAVMQC